MKNNNQINVFDVADYILKNNKRPITHMKLHKLIFYAHAKHLTTYKKPLINDPIQAWKFGPVFPDLYPVFKEYTFENIYRKTKKGDSANIKGTFQKAIDYIISNYGYLNGQQLSERTHFEAPWQDAFEKGVNAPINNEAILNFYKRKNKL